MFALLTFLLVLAFGLYFSFRARAQWKKRVVDELVGSLRLLCETGKYVEYDEIYNQLRDFGREHCIEQPMFNVEEHFNQAVHTALVLRDRCPEPTVNVPKRRGRIGGHKV